MLTWKVMYDFVPDVAKGVIFPPVKRNWFVVVGHLGIECASSYMVRSTGCEPTMTCIAYTPQVGYKVSKPPRRSQGRLGRQNPSRHPSSPPSPPSPRRRRRIPQ
jgi:hypothetical protein